MALSICLVRHGQTQLNRQRRYQGRQESPLTTYGQGQVAALARRLQRLPFQAAYISPTERGRETAHAILGARSVEPVEDERWREVDHGRWEGLSYAEVTRQFPDEAQARFADPLHGRALGGESIAEVNARVASGWEQLLQNHQRGHVLIVTHATPIQLVLCQLSELPPALHWRWRVDLGSLTLLDLYPSGPIVRVVNEVPRLDHRSVTR